MADIIEQDEEIILGEDEEFGDLDELRGATSEQVEEEAEPEEFDEPEKPKIPKKFENKSLEDVVRSYEELEKALGRKNNEVGELRKLTDDILKQSLKLDSDSGNPARKKIEVDDILEDPDKAIEEALNSHPRLKQLEERFLLEKRKEEEKAFESKHPDWREVIQTDNFQQWVTASPVRQRLFMEADKNYDYQTGDELLSLYKEVTGTKVQEAEEQRKVKRDKALKAATTEKGSSNPTTKKIFRRSDLLKMMQYNRDKYEDPVFQAELMKAYQEGRVR